MSNYEHYDEKSKHYDLTRTPIGLEIILGCFASAGRPLETMRILDAGCGTGSYLMLLSPQVGRICGVDASVGMLDQTKRKLAAGKIPSEKVSVHHGSIDQLPFENGSFDAVMVNQVVHHLPDDPTQGYPALRATLEEFARVTRVGGVLVINICSTEQLQDGSWYSDLFAGAFKELIQRHIPLPQLSEMLRECGFDHRGNIVPVDAVFQGDAYFEATGPLRKEWRDGDSVFTLATDEELEQACGEIRRLQKEGVLEQYFEEQDSRRKQIGPTTFVHAVRRS